MSGSARLLGCAAAFAACMALSNEIVPAAAAQEAVLRAASNIPTNVWNARQFIRFAERVNELGKGKVQINMLGGPEVIPTPRQGDAVRTGVLDIGFGIAAFYKSQVPHGDALIAATIGAVESREQGHTAYLDKIWRERINATFLAWSDSGVGWNIFLIDEPKRTPSGGVDLSGIQLRTSGSTRDFVRAVGAIPAVVHATETYTALERRVVQGNLFPPTGVTDYGWEKFLKWRIDPHVLQTNLVTMVNLDKWRSLSQDARELLQREAIAFEKESIERLNAEIDAEWQRQKAAGMQIVALEGAERERYLEAARDTYWSRIKTELPDDYDELRRRFYQAGR